MTTLHKVVLRKDDGIVDLFNAATAVPPIAAGVAGYIQNISNFEVRMSDTVGFGAELIIGSKLEQSAISTLTFGAGDSVFLQTNDYLAVVTVAVG